jgi:hypothetical protein
MSTILASAKPTIQIVRLANALIVKSKIGNSGDYSQGTVSEDMLKPLGLKQEQLSLFLEGTQNLMQHAGALLNAYR